MSSNETPANDEKLEERLKMLKEFHHHHPRRILFVPLMLGFLAAKAAVIMLLWNELIPGIFSGPVLTYLQAVGLMVLAKLLFGHFGPGGFRHHGPPWGRRHHWKERLWQGLSHEERHQLRDEFKKRLREGRL